MVAVGGGFDPDRFGYFDLVEELNKLGFQSWKRLSFKKPWSVVQVDIKSDVEVMEMIALLRKVRTQMCYVYVVDGKNGEQEQILLDKPVGVGSSGGGEAMKQTIIESVKKSNVESVVKSNIHSITKRKKETTGKNGTHEAVEESFEKTMDKSVQKSVQKSLLQSKSVVESEIAPGSKNGKGSGSAPGSKDGRGSGSSPGSKDGRGSGSAPGSKDGRGSGSAHGSKDGRGSRSASVSKYDRGSRSASVPESVLEVAVQSMGEGAGEGMGEGAGEGMWEGAGEEFDDSDEDGSYIPSCEEDETDDDMDAEELVSEDEEYTQGRRKLKEKKVFVITDDMFLGIEDGGQKRDYVSEYENSEEDDIYSDSTDFEDEGRRNRDRHAKVMYDPRCDHKQLKLSVGMGFIDGFQARDAITDNAVENGWQIHFKRANKKQFEAACQKPCQWRCSGSLVSKNGAVVIKKLEEVHTCPRAMRNKIVTSTWIARKYLHVFRLKPSMSCKDLGRDLMQRMQLMQ